MSSAVATVETGATRAAGRVEPLKFLDPDEVRRVAEMFGTPTFVYDEGSIRRAAESMTTLPSAYGLTVRYSLKACPSAAVIRLFANLGLAFDASSQWEVMRAVRAGVDPSRILLTAQEAVMAGPLLDLLDRGLEFDAGSLRQLDAYGQARPGSQVSVRLNPGFGSGLVRRLTSGGPNSSFGIWHEDIGEVKRIVQRHDLRLVRLHTHIGSGHHADVLTPAAQLLLGLCRDFEDVRTLDLGGGYRITTFLDDPVHDHAEWAAPLADDLRDFAEETGRELHLELEPGTYLMANAGSIVSRVIDAGQTGPDGRRFLKVDTGLSEIIRPSYYGSLHPLVGVPASGPMRDEVADYCVVGHCCIAGDVLTTRAGDVEHLEPMALARTEPGDLLVVERAGGYCSSMALKNFNSYPEAAEVLRRTDGSFDLIRERQTLDQLVANERVPADL